MRKLIVSFCLVMFSTLIICAEEPRAITVTTRNGATVTVTALTPNILRVSNRINGLTPRPDDPSLRSTLKLASLAGKPIKGNTLSTSAGMTAVIDNKSGSVNISAPGMSITDSGSRETSEGKQEITLYTGSAGSFYGAGERGHSFNLKGDTLVMYNRQNYGYTKGDPRISQMNITMPLFLSNEGFAIVFDDFAPATMVLQEPIIYTTDATWPIDFYVVYGNGNMPETSEMLSQLIGRQELPPLWSLGYITSRYGYRTQDETLGVIDSLKTEGYPVDGIVLDLYWYGKEEDMGRLEWDSEQWPEPERMLRELKEKGVNLVAISQPYVLANGRGLENFNILSENRMLALDSAGNTHPVTIWVGEGGMLDVSNPATIEWLRNRYRNLTETGISGWWGDLGEPEVHPATAFHYNGLSAPLYHNRYGNDWSRIIYDLFKEEYPNTRLMTLMRGGTTGLQQYNVFPWSTDVSRSWGGLQPQITIMLNSSLSGLGYMSHDVGGFAIDPDNPIDPELYVRWLQLGLFSPILRTHAQAYAEPYLYPEQQDIILPLVKARYRWLPYNYSLAFENALLGLPLVRPINYYSGDTETDNITDEYLWGRDVLVAPVLNKGVTARDITFPQGTDKWIDLNNPSVVYEGGSTVTDYPAPLDIVPLFVREGAFIPSAPYTMENTGDYKTNLYRVDYYPLEGSESEYILYEDNPISTGSIEKNQYLAIEFHGMRHGNNIQINIKSKGDYPGLDVDKIIEMVINGVSSPSKVTVNGNMVNYTYDADLKALLIPMHFNTSSQSSLKIEF